MLFFLVCDIQFNSIFHTFSNLYWYIFCKGVIYFYLRTSWLHGISLNIVFCSQNCTCIVEYGIFMEQLVIHTMKMKLYAHNLSTNVCIACPLFVYSIVGWCCLNADILTIDLWSMDDKCHMSMNASSILNSAINNIFLDVSWSSINYSAGECSYYSYWIFFPRYMQLPLHIYNSYDVSIWYLSYTSKCYLFAKLNIYNFVPIITDGAFWVQMARWFYLEIK